MLQPFGLRVSTAVLTRGFFSADTLFRSSSWLRYYDKFCSAPIRASAFSGTSRSREKVDAEVEESPKGEKHQL